MSALTQRIDRSILGVYLITQAGGVRLAHEYRGGAYALADIFDFFELGEVLTDDGPPGIELDAHELRKLSEMARRYYVDHPPEFAQMCLDMACAVELEAMKLEEGEMATFYANF